MGGRGAEPVGSAPPLFADVPPGGTGRLPGPPDPCHGSRPMATVAQLQTDLDDVDAALRACYKTALGVVSYSVSLPGGGSRTVTRSLDQLLNVRKVLRAELQEAKAAASGGGAPVNYGIRGNL